MKVFLGNSPWSKEGLYGVRAGSRWPHFENADQEYMPFPFFLAYATAVLEQNDTEVMLVDAIAEHLCSEEFYQHIQKFGPDLIVLEVSTPSLQTDHEHWLHIRKMVGTDVKIALTGIHHPMQTPAWLNDNPEIDFVLVGEYEYTLRDLVNRLEKRESVMGIDGLIHRGDSGDDPTWTGKRPLIKNLDEVPWPARHYLPMYDYRDEPGSIARPSVQVWASRGCPYRCSFCAWPQIMYGGFKYRTRNVVDVIDETEWLVQQWGFKSVYYDDDTFNIGKKRMLQFCREFKARQLGVPWAIMARIDGMDDEILEAMADSGLAALKYGVESAEQSIVDKCGKRLDVSKVRNVVNMTHSLGIKVHLTFMFGLPGETYDSAMRTLDLALELMPESLQFTLATPFPGSKLHTQLLAEGKIQSTDYSKYDGFHTAVVATDDLSASDLEDILCQANTSWDKARTKRLLWKDGESEACEDETKADEAESSADEGSDSGPTIKATGDGNGAAKKPGPPRPLVSVIVPNYNGEAVLAECLTSIKLQTYSPIQLIVVDDASTDQSMMIAEQFFDDVEVIKRSKNGGFAATVNEGLKAARGKYIALLNMDAKAEERWIEASLDALRRISDAGVIQPKVLTFDDPCTYYSVGIGVTRSGYAFNIGQGALEEGQFNEGRYVLGATGAASVWRREVFEIIGNFDEDLGHYLEDVDLSLRAQLEGIRCYYEPGAVVQHWGGKAAGGQNGALQVRQVSRNVPAVLLKDLPRSVLQQNALRMGGSLLALYGYHAMMGRGVTAMEGLLEGLKLSGQMVAKRKRVLGLQKVTDERIIELMEESEVFLMETAEQLKTLPRARLRLMGMV